MSPPIFAITVQASILSVISSFLAQFLTAYQTQTPLSIDWEPVIKFFVYAVVSTPPNVVWQDFLERTFPGFNKPEPAKADEAPAVSEKVSDKVSDKPTPPKETLNIPHTLIKTALDQSIGATVNTVMFCVFMAVYPLLTTELPIAHAITLQALSAAAVARTRVDFWPFMVASWRFWPIVSLGNFALVTDVATRNLVAGLAGVVWGVYVSLLAAAPVPAAASVPASAPAAIASKVAVE